jgi:hypothetical protein
VITSFALVLVLVPEPVWKMSSGNVHRVSFGHFFGRLHDQRRALRIEQTEIVIRLRRGPLDQPQGANKWTRNR